MVANNSFFGLDKFLGSPLIRVTDIDTGETLTVPRPVASGMVLFGGNFELKTLKVQQGFINKAGAITPTGRNVVNSAFNSIGERQEFSWRFKKEQVIDIAKDA